MVVFLVAFLCWNFTRGREITVNWDNSEKKKENILKNYLSVLKIKPTKFLACTVIAMSLVNTIISSGIVYLMSNVLAYSPAKQSTTLATLTIISILWLPVINYLSKKFDKKIIYTVAISVCTLFLLTFTFIGFQSHELLIIYLIGIQFGISSFWTLYFAMMYDICELDEFITGKRREGTIAALFSFFQKCGAAIATWLIGVLLTFSHYDAGASVQTGSAERMINYLVTLVPSILGAITIIFALMYPLTGKRFTALLNALELKRSGKEYTTDGFEKLL